MKIYVFIALFIVSLIQVNGQCPPGATDTDLDGICDNLDHDDDNDGIRDFDESICTSVLLDTLSFSGVAVAQAQPLKLTFGDNSGWRTSYSAQTFSLPITLKFKGDNDDYKMIGFMPVGANQISSGWNDDSYKAYLHPNGRIYAKFPDVWNFSTPGTHGKPIEIKIDINGILTIHVDNEAVNSPISVPIGPYHLTVSSLYGGILEEVTMTQNNVPCAVFDLDTDEDGIPNRIDLDSDNDICVDAFEGSANFGLNDMDNIGRLTGAVNTDVNSSDYGIPVAAASGQSVHESKVPYTVVPDRRECLCIASNNPVDSDNDGVCDIADLCTVISDALIGTPCNDGDDCTTNDIWTATCECQGTFADSDGDSVCDNDDNCPDFDDQIDMDKDDIPDCQDTCIDINENGTCDDQEAGFAVEKLKLYTSHRRGFYEQPFSLELLTNDPNASIYYTTDGSPVTSNSQLYNGNPISVSGTTILRSVAHGSLDSTRTITHSYLFLEDIVQDSTLKSYIVEHPIWGNRLKSALLDIPSISLVSDSIINADTTVAGSMEMIYPDTKENFQANCGLENYGNASLNLPKRNIRMHFDSLYGPKNLKQSIFEGFENGIHPITKFDKLDLRSSHEAWTWDGNELYRGETYITTKVMDDLMLRGGSINPHNRFVHVYIDGKYWGQYDLREKFDDNMLAEYHGLENEDYDFISGSKVTVSCFYPVAGVLKDGSGNDWAALVNSSDDYHTWKTMVDENSFFDLMLLFMFGYAEAEWNAAGAPSKGKEFLFQNNDADLFFSRGQFNRMNRTYPYHNANGPDDMFLRLYNEGHPDFIQDFGDRAAFLMNYDGLLTPAVLNAHVDEMAAMIENSIIGEAAKWSGEGTEHPDQWKERIQHSKDSMIDLRLDYVIAQMKKTGIYPKLDPVVFSIDEGLIPENMTLDLINPNTSGTIYYTIDSSDPRQEGGAISASAIQYSSAIPIPSGVTQVNARIKGQETRYPETNIAVNKPISASRILSNYSVEAANDGVIWGVTTEYEVAYVSNNAGEDPWLEIDLGTVEDIDLVRVWNSSNVAIIRLLHYPYIFVSDQPFTSPLVSDLLADPNVQSFQFNEDGADVFEVPVNTQGRYVRLMVDRTTRFYCSEFEIIQIDDNNPIVTDIWSPMVPQTYYTDIDYSPIAINEIHYNQDTSRCGTDSLDVEFLEIVNSGMQAINLSGCLLSEGLRFSFPYGTVLNPGDFLVLAEDTTEFQLAYGFNAFGQYAGALDNGGEYIKLSNPFGNTIDSVVYNDRNPWDEDPDGYGPSLELLNPTYDNSDALSWFRSDNTCGTPGAANSRVCMNTAEAIVINEINYNSNNNVSDPGDWVELHNPNASSIDISGWTFYDNNNEFIFPVGTILEPDAYLVLVENGTMFSSVFPNVPALNLLGDFDFGLSNKGERISLFDENKCLSDYVVYDDRLPWDSLPDGNGPTLSLITPSLDNALPDSWEASSNINAPLGTPGRANVPCPTYSIIHPATICKGDSILLHTTPADNVSFTWTIQGGTPATATGDSVYVVFQNPGLALIELQYTHFECVDSDQQLLTIETCNAAPATQPDIYTINEDSLLAANVLTNDQEPENQPMIVSLINDVVNGALALNSDGSFTYIPNLNYFGSDQFIYEVCDNATPVLCAQETVTINILSVNDLPIVNNDSLTTDEAIQVAGNVSTNDFDVETTPMHYTLTTFSQNGSILFNFDGSFYYTPFPGFSGIDSFQYQACDNGSPIYCETATVYIEVIPACVLLDIALILEGAFNSQTGYMKTDLNTVRAILPGMTGNPIAGQPYNSSPWNYNGTEGLGWTDTDYPATVVDWVLISFRTGVLKSTEVYQIAGLLHSDGSVTFPGECLTTADLSGSYYIVVEHRNHMAVMSPQKVSVSNRELSWDFRLADSYAVGGSGAKLLNSGLWVLHAGDCNQADDVVSYDINGQDKSAWLLDNGKFGVYLSSDINMNGDVNGADKAVWLLNNGVFSSVKK